MAGIMIWAVFFVFSVLIFIFLIRYYKTQDKARKFSGDTTINETLNNSDLTLDTKLLILIAKKLGVPELEIESMIQSKLTVNKNKREGKNSDKVVKAAKAKKNGQA